VKLPFRSSDGCFRENAIDGEVSCGLRGGRFEEFGVTVVGERQKMLTAIGKLSALLSPFGAKRNFS
jgi:hypothetical protein